MLTLREHQGEVIEDVVVSLRTGIRRLILQMPTAGGKTLCAVEIIRRAVKKNKFILFLAPRRELIKQASKRLFDWKIEHGIIMSQEPRNLYAKVQVASFDTLYARGIRNETMVMPPADLVIVDEAHLSLARTRKEIIASYPDAVVIGLTATPARGDGRGLGEIYQDIVFSWSIKKLTDAGYLSPITYFAPSKPDLKGLKESSDGDYVVTGKDGLGSRVDKPKLIGDIVENWFRIAKDRQTVVFCATRKHSIHVADEFKNNGIKAEHVDGDTPLDERQAILERVASSETQVVCNVFVCSYGLDIPTLDCAVIARPTKNITLYLQMAGRIMRPSENGAILIDHAGVVEEHGFVDDYIPWSLDGDESVKDRKKKLQEERAEPKEIICKACGAAFKNSRICPSCGCQMIPHGQAIPVHEANLEEIKREKNKKNREMTPEEKASFYGGLKQYAKQKGFAVGWASHAYRDKTGVWPNRYENAELVPPSEEVLNYIRHKNIKYAKRRQA